MVSLLKLIAGSLFVPNIVHFMKVLHGEINTPGQRSRISGHAIEAQNNILFWLVFWETGSEFTS